MKKRLKYASPTIRSGGGEGTMRMERMLAVFVISTLLVIPSTAVRASSSVKANTVILVSDNPADWAMARLVSNLTGFPVVVTHWGVYTPVVSSRIYSYSPRRVIIIGGPLAVPEYYTEDMKAVNITVVRWGGENRYGTNRAVLSGIKEFGVLLNQSPVVSAGYDPVSISKALEIAINHRAPLVYINNSQVQVKASIAVLSPWTGIKVKALKVVVVNVTASELLALLNEVGQKLDALRLLVNSTNITNIDISRYMVLANNLLANAKLSLSMRDYRDAYRLINRANYLTDRAIRITESNKGVSIDVIMGTMQLMLHGIKPLNPLEYTRLQKLVKEYREYLREHNYTEAQRVLMVIRIDLMKVYSKQAFIPSPHPAELLSP